MQKIKMPLLWAIFTAVAFFSCGDVTDPDISPYNIPENDCEVKYIGFAKVYVFYSDWLLRNSPYKVRMGFGESINDCKIGDTVTLVCDLYDNTGTYSWEYFPESVIVRVTTSRGDISFIKLFVNFNISYSDELPPAPRRYNSHTIILNNRSYRNGDILTAEIKDKNKILKTTLNIKE